MNTVSKNKIFDIILADALREIMDSELENITEAEPHVFPDEFEKIMKGTANSVGRKKRIKKYAHMGAKAVITATAIFGILFGGLLTRPEVYASVQNVIRGVFDKYDKYEFDGGELTVESFDDSFRLGYVPDGYYLSEGHYSPIGVLLKYTHGFDENSNEIFFDYGIADASSIYLDNEHHTYEEFTINGIEYNFYESTDKDFMSNLLWYEDGYVFIIYAHLPKDEFVKIAENIEK